MPRSSSNVLLVGSVPLDSAEEVFKPAQMAWAAILRCFQTAKWEQEKVGSSLRPFLSSTATPRLNASSDPSRPIGSRVSTMTIGRSD